MRTLIHTPDVCIVGGGLSGLCAAVSAARHGAKVVLVQDRPVLGGNSSGEIRMWVCGAHGQDNRETGLIEEMELENFYRNEGQKFSIWETVLYETAMAEKNLTLLLNAPVFDAVTEDSEIREVTAWQSNAETFHKIRAKTFIDCSGDSILAPLSGAHFRYGREAKSDFNETIPPDKADKKTMGMSVLFQIRKTDHPVKFVPPDWANVYETDADLPYKDHNVPNNFWWIELGGEWDCLHDTDKCRHELLKICWGVWDHMKNRGDHGAENYELEWIGFLPGKRESRRYVGLTTVTQNDVEAGGNYPDTVAYAGWTMDDHFPEGFYYAAGHPTIYHPAPSPWGLPLRCMISENIKNLCFAGRNISVTHAALSSSRVMATCSLLGQAIGTACAMACAKNCRPEEVPIGELQQVLMEDDCFLPGFRRNLPPLSLSAHCSAPVVLDGTERGESHLWKGKTGETVTFTLDHPTRVSAVRLVFDSDLNRKIQNMPCTYMPEVVWHPPVTLIRDYEMIYTLADGSVKTETFKDSHHRLVYHSVNEDVTAVTFRPLSTWGAEDFRLFSFEIR